MITIRYGNYFINGEDKSGKVEELPEVEAMWMVNLGYAEIVQKSVQETVHESDTTSDTTLDTTVDVHEPIWPQETRRLRGKSHGPKA